MTTASTFSPTRRTRPAGTRRRWYGHGWNRPVSWELIFRITPRLPRFLLIPLHHATTLLCFLSMPRERRAVRRNLARVTGRTGWALTRLTYRLFLQFSRFLVAYTDIRGSDLEPVRARTRGLTEAERTMRDLIGEGRGLILATMHLGHWDLGVKLLRDLDVPVHLVMRSEEPAEVTRYAGEARWIPSLRVHQVGDSPFLAVDLMRALQRGEVVAIQTDRAAGDRVLPVPMFGSRVDLPVGPVQLARVTGAPLLPVFFLLEEWGWYRLLLLPPLRFPDGDQAGPGDPIREAMELLAATMESVIARHPDQWFNFFDVWAEGPPVPSGTPPAEAR